MPTMSGRGARRRIARGRGGLLLIAALLILGGVAVADRSATQSKAARGPVRAGVPADGASGIASAASGRRAPGFELVTIDGRRFSLAGQRGKVVVLDFLAPGCPSCAASLRPLRRTALRFGPRRVRFLVVDVSGANDSSGLRAYYYSTYRLPRRVLIGEDRGFRIARAYRLNQLGLTFVIGRDGHIRWQGVWGSDDRKLAAHIRAALSQ